MSSTASPSKLERQLREMNEALLISSVRQHELTEQAERVQEELRDRESRLAAELAATQTLQRISTELIQEGDHQALYERILDAAVAIMHSDFASIQMLYPEEGAQGSGGQLRLLGYRGFTPEAARAWECIRADHSTTCGMALRTGARCIVADVETCCWPTAGPAFERRNPHHSIRGPAGRWG